ncbi:MAG: hypothetical protein RL041_398, partial [Bacteroidota bacterium]
MSIELILKENMAEYRLAKVATELNRSFQALADLLNQQGFDVMPKPTTKITEDMYQALLREFSADKAAKDEAKLLKSNRDPKPAAVIPVATKPTPAVEVLAKVEPKAQTPEPIPQEKMASKLEELAGPKILGKIDIGKKKTVEAPPAKVETPVKDVVAEPVVVEKPIEVAP